MRSLCPRFAPLLPLFWPLRAVCVLCYSIAAVGGWRPRFGGPVPPLPWRLLCFLLLLLLPVSCSPRPVRRRGSSSAPPRAPAPAGLSWSLVRGRLSRPWPRPLPACWAGLLSSAAPARPRRVRCPSPCWGSRPPSLVVCAGCLFRRGRAPRPRPGVSSVPCGRGRLSGRGSLWGLLCLVFRPPLFRRWPSLAAGLCSRPRWRGWVSLRPAGLGRPVVCWWCPRPRRRRRCPRRCLRRPRAPACRPRRSSSSRRRPASSARPPLLPARWLRAACWPLRRPRSPSVGPVPRVRPRLRSSGRRGRRAVPVRGLSALSVLGWACRFSSSARPRSSRPCRRAGAVFGRGRPLPLLPVRGPSSPRPLRSGLSRPPPRPGSPVFSPVPCSPGRRSSPAFLLSAAARRLPRAPPSACVQCHRIVTVLALAFSVRPVLSCG